jgi:hypothetical protein
MTTVAELGIEPNKDYTLNEAVELLMRLFPQMTLSEARATILIGIVTGELEIAPRE